MFDRIALAFVLALCTSAANAVLITVPEDGVGQIISDTGFPFPTTAVLAADPGPGGLAAALTFDLLRPPTLVAGDVKILETAGGILSDVVRFNPAGTGSPGYPASLVFYSDNIDGVDALADTGFPAAFYTNVVTFIESDIGGGETGLLYTPTSSQPGFVPGFSVTYRIVSDDDAAVPEPMTLALLALGLAGIGVSRRRIT